jgi:hypothetical protein
VKTKTKAKPKAKIKCVHASSLPPGTHCKLPDDPEFLPPLVWEVISVSASSVRVREVTRRQRTVIDPKTEQEITITEPAKAFSIAGTTMVEVVREQH